MLGSDDEQNMLASRQTYFPKTSTILSTSHTQFDYFIIFCTKVGELHLSYY